MDEGGYQPFSKIEREYCEECGALVDRDTWCALHETKAWLMMERERIADIHVGDRVLVFDARGNAYQATVFSEAKIVRTNGMDDAEAITVALDGIPRVVDWPVNDVEKILDD